MGDSHLCIQPIVFKWEETFEQSARRASGIVPLNCSISGPYGNRHNTNPASLYPLNYQNFSNWPERVVFKRIINIGEKANYDVWWALGEMSSGGVEHYIEVVEPYSTRLADGTEDMIPVTSRRRRGDADVYVYDPRHAKYEPKHGCREGKSNGGRE
jgi:hypothetical protein